MIPPEYITPPEYMALLHGFIPYAYCALHDCSLGFHAIFKLY